MPNTEIAGAKPQRYDHLVEGQPIAAAGYQLTPVARLSGWRWLHPNGQAGFAFVHLSPTEVIVQPPDGAEQRLPLTIPTKNALFGMLGGAAALAAVCTAVMVLARLLARR